MQKPRTRFLALLLGAIPASAFLWAVYPHLIEKPVDSVQFVDVGPSIDELSEFLATSEKALIGMPRGKAGHLLLTEPVMLGVFGSRNREFVYDPLTYFRRRAFLNRRVPWAEHPDGEFYFITNSLGLRDHEELSRERPWRRVLVTGDSHTDGVCNNEESFPNRLEVHLREGAPGRSFESLNAGVGGYSFYNYLGAYDRYQEFGLDAVVVGVYGGNDFYEILAPSLLFAGEKRRTWEAYGDQLKQAQRLDSASVSQGYMGCAFFHHNPDLIQWAESVSIKAMLQLQRQCQRDQVDLIVVYIPPAYDVPSYQFSEVRAEVREVLELTEEDLAVAGKQADGLLGSLREAGATVLDMRSLFRDAKHRLYWEKDLHISIEAHDLIARELAPLLEVSRDRNHERRARETAEMKRHRERRRK
jgi:lysophospholipase L1-like esterase